MYKLIGFIRYRPDLSHQEAADHWRQQHGPLVSRIPGLTSYVQNYVQESLPPQDGSQPASPGWDGYMWHLYPDKDTMEAASKSAEWAAVIADGATFINQSVSNMGPADEVVVTDGARGSYKVAVLSVSGGHQTPSALPGVSRYVLSRLNFPDSEEDPADRILEEFWFPDAAGYRRTAANPEWKQRVGGSVVKGLWSGSVAEVTVKG